MKEPRQILESWMQAVNNADLAKLLSLYNEDAVLIPTFSNRILKGRASLQPYFEKLASKDDLSIALHENTLHIASAGEYLMTLSGIYNWRFAVDSEILNFEARFSYLIDPRKEAAILHHHSSQIPRVI